MTELSLPDRYRGLVLESFGETLQFFGLWFNQNHTETGELSGQLANGLERTASYLRGESWTTRIAPQHVNWEKVGKELAGEFLKHLSPTAPLTEVDQLIQRQLYTTIITNLVEQMVKKELGLK